MQQPLVLAIEPDVRQAAIVKRIVREKVLADVTVVDSRDAALEAMRTTVPDVLLLSALLSPRDEDELIAHLRTLRDAEHLQTHTIPQLASSIGEESKKSKGLLSAFRRRKDTGGATAGCDPDLFADEIRTYLKRASDKKREVREAPPVDPMASPVTSAASTRTAAQAQPIAQDEPNAESSWSDPFAWKPTQSRTVDYQDPASEITQPHSSSAVDQESSILDLQSSAVGPPPAPIFDAEPEPAIALSETIETYAPAVVESYTPAVVEAYESVVAQSYEPVVVESYEPAVVEAYESVVVESYEPVVAESYEPVVVEAYEPTVVESYEPAVVDRYEPAVEIAAVPRVKYPLTMRTPKGWFFVEGKFVQGKAESLAGEPDSELREVLAQLAVPARIAGVVYAEGCRIRRVRLAAA